MTMPCHPAHATLRAYPPFFQWATATTYAYHFKVIGPVREVCLDAKEANETHEGLITRIPREERLWLFMSTQYSERPHQRRREYKGEVHPSEHDAGRSV